MAEITAVIPTYRREQVLIDTIRHLLALSPAPAEILLVDQTPAHEPATEAVLAAWREEGLIRWIRLDRPSIPRAMNLGLWEARHGIVLFLDDDIEPQPGLVEAHGRAHQESGAALVAGRVIQPWDRLSENREGFASREQRWVGAFMGGNFSIAREFAMRLGGFDENFIGAAYRFEAEFADRLLAAGGRILFEPAAAIRHLKAEAGGTRAFGRHLTTFKPYHAVGAYYYLLRSARPRRRVRQVLGRWLGAAATRHHLRRPWWIPATLIAESWGFLWAIALAARGPRYGQWR